VSAFDSKMEEFQRELDNMTDVAVSDSNDVVWDDDDEDWEEDVLSSWEVPEHRKQNVDGNPPRNLIRCIQVENGRPLRGYHKDAEPFIRVHVLYPHLINALRNVLTAFNGESDYRPWGDGAPAAPPPPVRGWCPQPPEHFDLYECNFDYVQRWLLDRGINGATPWLRAENMAPVQNEYDRISTCELEFRVNESDVRALTQRADECNNAELELESGMSELIAWDIEVVSPRGVGFPDPDTHTDRCPIVQIGVSHSLFRGAERVRRAFHIFVLGSCPPIQTLQGEDIHVWAFATEAHMLESFRNFVVGVDPEYIIDFNGANFDRRYFLNRAEHLGVGKVCSYLGRRKFQRMKMVKRVITTRANGAQTIYKGVAAGRALADLCISARKGDLGGAKLKSNTLNAVAAHFLEGFNQKAEIAIDKLEEINKTEEGRGRIAVYCVQDCDLLVRIVDRLGWIPDQVEHAGLVGVTVSNIITKGVQIRVTSSLFHAAKALPVPLFIPYEPMINLPPLKGAIVLKPKTGFYSLPVGCLDFESLYPSIGDSFNGSWETIPTEDDIVRYGFVEGKDYHRPFEGIPFLDKSILVGIWVLCTRTMLEKRRAVKKEMKKFPENSHWWKVLNAKQMALKRTANSYYGYTADPKSPNPEMRIARTITGVGRVCIMESKRLISRFQRKLGIPFDAEVVYGDSVVGDTAVVVRIDGAHLHISRIDELVPDQAFRVDLDGKESWNPQGRLEVWSDGGFVRVERMMRHMCKKNIMRVVTHTGIVDVTEDHSLLLEDRAQPISPKKVHAGDALLHALPAFLDNLPVLASDLDLGAFSLWELGYRVGRGLFGEALPVHLFFNGAGELRVPDEIVFGPAPSAREFFRGLVSAQNCGYENEHSAGLTLKCRGKELATAVWLLAVRERYNVSINPQHDPNMFMLTLNTHTLRKSPTHVKKVVNVGGVLGYVYDFETVSGHFAVAPGNMVVHNTDSIMILFSRPERGLEQTDRPDRMDIGETFFWLDVMGDYISRHFTPPIRLRFEKTMMPFLLMAKKAYAFRKYEGFEKNQDNVRRCVDWLMENPTGEIPGGWPPADSFVKSPRLTVRGLDNVRRSAAELKKTMIEEVLRLILMEDMVGEAVKYVRDTLEELLSGNMSFDRLIMSAQFAKKVEDYKVLPAHVALAVRMQQRQTAGVADDAPLLGDRVQHIAVPASKRAKKVEFVEDPKWAASHGIPYNASWYLNHHLRKPLERILVPVIGIKRTADVFDGKRVVRGTGTLREFKRRRTGRLWNGFVVLPKCARCHLSIQQTLDEGEAGCSDGPPAPVGDMLCGECACALGPEGIQQLLNADVDKLIAVEKTTNAIHAQCTTCAAQSGLKNIDDCATKDCTIFWQRTKAREQLAKLRKTADKWCAAIGVDPVEHLQQAAARELGDIEDSVCDMLATCTPCAAKQQLDDVDACPSADCEIVDRRSRARARAGELAQTSEALLKILARRKT